MASMEYVQQWEWPVMRFWSSQYVEEYRFFSLDQVALHEVCETFVQGVKQIYDHLQQLFEPHDYLSSILKLSVCMLLYSFTINWKNMNTAKHLDWISTLLQSQSKLHLVQTFWLALSILKAIGGGVARPCGLSHIPKP